MIVYPILKQVAFFLGAIGVVYLFRTNTVVLAVLAIFISVFASIYFNQDQILYIPSQELVPGPLELNPAGLRSPNEHNIVYEDVYIETSDKIKIHGWYLPNPSESSQCYTMLYFHGNAGNIGTRIDLYKSLLLNVPINLLAIDYRGYGESDGYPSEQGLQKDAIATLEYILTRNDINKEKIIIFGRSLGGAVALYLANERPSQIKGVIVENIFTSIRDFSMSIFPYLKIISPVIPYLLNSKWENDRILMKGLNVPLLYITTKKDEIIPKDQSDKILSILKSQPDLPVHHHIFETGGHNSIPLENSEIYHTLLKDFLDKLPENK